MSTFAAAVLRSVSDASAFEDRIRAIQDRWRGELGRLRADSAADLLISALPGAPLLTVAGASDLIGRSYQQTNQAIARLVERGILVQVSIGNRNRAFEAPSIIDAFIDLERRLASPEGNTLSSPPARRVPRRR
jgi:Fic family protein